MRLRAALASLAVAALAGALSPGSAWAHDEEPPEPGAAPAPALSAEPCVDGSAGGYPCRNVDLQSFLPLSDIGGGNANDIWGWTDPQTGKEYALLGRTSGTSFVDISDPINPVYLGNLPTATSNSSWRDLKVYANHVYVVSEASGHGMQVFDLTRLRGVTSPRTWDADARDTSFGGAHNIAINEDSGYAYVIGSNTCNGGPRMFDLSSPKQPAYAGCVSGDGYTHDMQAVNYHGPDSRYQGKEILFNANEDTLTIVDASTKSSPNQLSRTGYSGASYTHQGWLTTDHRYFLLNDETGSTSPGTRTYVFDVSDLQNPSYLGYYAGETGAGAHNLYNTDTYSYQANYKAGLRIIDLANVGNPGSMTEAGYFDVYPSDDGRGYSGSWSNYPFFASGNVIVSSIDRGLFVVKPNFGDEPPPANDFSISVSPDSGTVTAGDSATTTVSTATTSGSAQTVNLSASGLPSGATASFDPSSVTSGGDSTLTISTSSSTPAGTYSVTVKGTGTDASHQTTYSLTVNGTGGCSSPGQKLGNPGFESGRTTWDATSGVIGQWGSYGQPAHSGSWLAWLDGYGNTHTDTLSQSVSLPAGCSSYTLTFWLHIDSSEYTTSRRYDTLTVQVGSTTIATYSNLDEASGYVKKSFDLSSYAGQTITLKFTGREDYSYQTSFVIDDTAITVA